MTKKKKAVETILERPPEPVSFDDAGEPEMSVLEVEQMMEQKDKESDLPAPIAPRAEVAPTQEAVAPAPVQVEGVHILDSSPIGSKIVVTEDGAILATPSTIGFLPNTDPAKRLPTGARIRKDAEGVFVATQLGLPSHDQRYETALSAIADFVPHFHPRS